MEGTVYKVSGLVDKPSVEEAPFNIAILSRCVITSAIFEILEHTLAVKGGGLTYPRL
jgi:UTP--glucose-1-phosphate uridylyltransferase